MAPALTRLIGTTRGRITLHQGLLREGAVALAVARDGGGARVAPAPDDEVRPGDALLVVRRRGG